MSAQPADATNQLRVHSDLVPEFSASCSDTPESETPLSMRQLAEIAVRQFYQCEGMSPPKLIIWLGSPLQGAMGADLLARIKCHGPSAIGRQLWELLARNDADAWYISEQVMDSIRSQVWAEAWEMVGRDIGHQIDMRIGRMAHSPSQHYRVWPHIVTVRTNIDTSTDEITDTPPSWESPHAREITNLLNQNEVLKHQYDLGESGEAIAHCLDYLVNEAGNSKFQASDPIVPYTSAQHARTKALYQIAQNCDWIWCFEGACILTEQWRASSRDSMGRLHCENGPALKYSDGTSFYLWHGVQVPRWVIETPSEITFQKIDDERNSEVRRIMIERYGLASYVVDSGFKRVQAMPSNHPIVGLRTASLWVQTLEYDEPLVYVDLLNSTAEPDGTTRRYMLRVDPSAYDGDTVRYVHAAAASTWRDADGQLIYTDWRDYAPSFES